MASAVALGSAFVLSGLLGLGAAASKPSTVTTPVPSEHDLRRVFCVGMAAGESSYSLRICITIADDGTSLPEPIFTLTQEQAETLAAQEQGHANADSLHRELVERWAAEIGRLAKLRADSPEGAKALKRAQAFISEGWALQAARLGWDEIELFGVCPRAPWQRLDRKGAAFGGAVVAVTAEAMVYVGGLRRYRAIINNDGGAVLIWELAGGAIK